MECNKDEALRAKALAERKMLEEDFAGARKMLNKAKQLSPELDISQMLTVCEVHCAAQKKVAGEIDWYGVLQVPPFTHDATVIMRQFRKLAFLVHPDRNQFAGADAAFKLLGEAKTTLADSSKHSVYDSKASGSVRVGTAAAGSPWAYQQSRGAGPVRPNSAPVHQQHQHQASTSAGSQAQCFICSVCGMYVSSGHYCSNCEGKQGVPYGPNQQANGIYSNAEAHRGPPANVSGVHAYSGAPQNFPGPQRNVPSGQQTLYATPVVQPCSQSSRMPRPRSKLWDAVARVFRRQDSNSLFCVKQSHGATLP